MNYTELEQSIQRWAEVDETDFVAEINNFIKSAEDRIFFALKGPLYWNAVTSGTMTIGNSQYTVAGGAIDLLDFYLNGVDSNTDGNSLERVDHSFLREAFPVRTGAGSSAYGVPRYYAVIEANLPTSEPNLTVRVAPAPDVAYTYAMSYYGKANTDSITSGNTPGGGATTETWISVVYPDLLVQGALERAASFLQKDPPQIAQFADPFNAGLLLLKNATESRQQVDDTTNMASKQAEGI
jgi:hypothetical protein